MPYGSTAPETLVSTHKADFGISYQDGLTEAAATGGDITSIFAITQKTDVVIGVRANSGDHLAEAARRQDLRRATARRSKCRCSST